MRVRDVESMQRTCSRTDGGGKERRTLERWRAGNVPIAWGGRRVSERKRIGNAPVAEKRAVESRNAHRRSRERAMHLK